MVAQRIHYENRENIASIQMDDGKVNAINATLMGELENAFQRAKEEQVKAVVLSGREKYFSAGLDLKTLPTLPKAEFFKVLVQFRQTTNLILGFERPVIASVSGHALAGGAIFMMACDHRVAAEGEYKIGLNETAIGIPLPSFVIALGKSMLAVPYHLSAILHAQVYPPAMAKEMAMVHETCPREQLQERAFQAAKRLGELPNPAYAIAKQRMFKEALAFDLEHFAQEAELFIKSIGLAE